MVFSDHLKDKTDKTDKTDETDETDKNDETGKNECNKISSLRKDLNLRPADYKSTAMPLSY